MDVKAQNIALKVTTSKSSPAGSHATKVVLNNLTATFRKGGLHVIMGPSGAGKSSLLNVIAGFQKPSSGCVKWNDSTLESLQKKKCSKSLFGYVEQNPVLPLSLTVREVFEYATKLRLGTMSGAQLKSCVDQVIFDLDLSHCQNARIAGAFARGISGGERRRVAIGVELLAHSPVLLLDEPTSGLDSTNAFQVVIILKRLAKQGHTVICTIHQPSQKMYDLFDSLLLLANGELMYKGLAEEAVAYFTEIGFQKPSSMPAPEFVVSVVDWSKDASLIGIENPTKCELGPYCGMEENKLINADDDSG